MLVGGTVFDRGDVLRYAFGKGFCWFLRCAVTLHPSMHTARGFLETFLVYGVVGDDWQHFFYALFWIFFLCRKLNFLQGGVKVLLLSSSPLGGWQSERVENLFHSPAFFLVRTSERGATRNAFCGATAFPCALFPLFSGGGYCDSSLFPFPKGNPWLRRGRHP